MKAIYTKYPYKFWSYGPLGEMHVLFCDHPTDSIEHEYETYSPNSPCDCDTWFEAAQLYMDCGGTIVLHATVEDDDYLFECVSGHQFAVAEMGDEYDLSVRLENVSDEELFHLMFDFFDVSAFEEYGWDGEYLGVAEYEFDDKGRLVTGCTVAA